MVVQMSVVVEASASRGQGLLQTVQQEGHNAQAALDKYSQGTDTTKQTSIFWTRWLLPQPPSNPQTPPPMFDHLDPSSLDPSPRQA